MLPCLVILSRSKSKVLQLNLEECSKLIPILLIRGGVSVYFEVIHIFNEEAKIKFSPIVCIKPDATVVLQKMKPEK